MSGEDKKLTTEERQQKAIGNTFGYDDDAETETKEEVKADADEKEEEVKGEADDTTDDNNEDDKKKEEKSETPAEEELASLFGGPEEGDEEDGDQGEPAATDEEKSKKPVQPEPVDLELDDDQFDEVTQSKEKFSEYLGKVRKATLEEARAEFKQELATAKEEIMRNIPALVSKSAERAQGVRTLAQGFYEKYPDLKNKRAYVRDMVATVSSQNTDWSAKQVLEEVANRAKRDLGISAKAEKREQERTDDPKFAGAGGRRVPGKDVDNRSKQQKMLDETFGF